MAAEYLKKPFAQWVLRDVQDAISAEVEATVGEEAYEVNRAYIEDGDHWQEGDVWPVRHADASIDAAILAAVEPMFVSVPLAEEAVTRQVDALLDKMPAVSITLRKPAGADGQPSDSQAERAAAMRELLNEWWDRVDFWQKVRQAGMRVAWAARGPLRLRFLPAAVMQARQRDRGTGEERMVERLRTGLSMEDALRLVYLSAPEPSKALLYTDPETQEQAALFLLLDESDQEYAEVWYEDGGQVVRRTLGNGDPVEFPLPLGRLPMGEMRGKLLLTEAVRRQQALADYHETMLGRTAQTAGFRDRVVINAEDNFYWSPNRLSDAAGQILKTQVDAGGRTWYAYAEPPVYGPGMVQNIRGLAIPANESGETYTTPSVTVIDPVQPETVIPYCTHRRATLLQSCHQGHVLEADKATSGYSKRQSRADFEKHVRSYKASAEKAIADVLTAAVAAALLMEKGEWRTFLEEYRITVTLSVDTGPLSAEELQTEVMLSEKLLKPRADVQAAAGVDDAEAADAVIAADPVQRLDLVKKQGEAFTAWSAANVEAGLQAAQPAPEIAAAARRQDFGEEQ